MVIFSVLLLVALVHFLLEFLELLRLLLVKHVLLLKGVFALHDLGQNGRLLCHEAALFNLQISNHFFQVRNTFVQVVASGVHVSNIVIEVFHLSVKLVSFVILLLQGLLQVLCLLLVVFVQLLLVVVQLLDLVVQNLDLLHLGCQDLFVVLFQLEVVHFGVTHVAHAVQLRIGSRQASAPLATNLADRLATALAVPDWVLAECTCEIRRAK